MKKYFLYIHLIFIATLISCGQNPMYDGVIDESEYNNIIEQEFKDVSTILVAGAQPVYLKFSKGATPEQITNVAANSKDWHLSSKDASWRMRSNSGTTANEVGSSGLGGVKVYKGVSFDEVDNIDYTKGLLNSDWEIDNICDYTGSFGSSGRESLNYYLNKRATYSGKQASDTYLFDFFSTTMPPADNAYTAGYEYVFIVKDGNGDNYVKIQAIQITTDGSGMSFSNRVYLIRFQMADDAGNFVGN